MSAFSISIQPCPGSSRPFNKARKKYKASRWEKRRKTVLIYRHNHPCRSPYKIDRELLELRSSYSKIIGYLIHVQKKLMCFYILAMNN